MLGVCAASRALGEEQGERSGYALIGESRSRLAARRRMIRRAKRQGPGRAGSRGASALHHRAHPEAREAATAAFTASALRRQPASSAAPAPGFRACSALLLVPITTATSTSADLLLLLDNFFCSPVPVVLLRIPRAESGQVVTPTTQATGVCALAPPSPCPQLPASSAPHCTHISPVSAPLPPASRGRVLTPSPSSPFIFPSMLIPIP